MHRQGAVAEVLVIIAKDVREIQQRLRSLETEALSTKDAQTAVLEIEGELHHLHGYLLGLLYRR